ncbi:MAG: class I tRNA ligase family protein, partial [Nitrososphaera sp.]|nr:class I tRNA ligase family protein [Nitrososphaera sp.]
DLQWYLKRTAAKGRQDTIPVLAEFLDIQIRMLAPFAPFTSEEVWELMGNDRSITAAGWPAVNENRIDPAAEESEYLISTLLADVQNIVKVTRITPAKIVVYACAPWKTWVYKSVLAEVLNGKTNFGEIMKKLIGDQETTKIKTDPKLAQKMLEDILSAPLDARNRRRNLVEFSEADAVNDASSLISSEINNAKIIVYCEDDPAKHDPKGKARSARPFKPAVYME